MAVLALLAASPGAPLRGAGSPAAPHGFPAAPHGFPAAGRLPDAAGPARDSAVVPASPWATETYSEWNGTTVFGVPDWLEGPLTGATCDVYSGQEYFAAGSLFRQDPGASQPSELAGFPTLQSLAFDATDGMVLASSPSTDSVVQIDPGNPAVQGNASLPYPVLYSTEGAAWDPANGELYVLTGDSSQDWVTSVGGNSDAAGPSIALGADTGPDSIVYDAADHDLFVGYSFDARVTVVSASSGAILKNVTTTSPAAALSVDPTTGTVYAAGGVTVASVMAISPTNLTQYASMSPDAGMTIPTSVAFDPTNGALFVTVLTGPNFLTGQGDWVGASNFTEFSKEAVGIEPDLSAFDACDSDLVAGYEFAYNATVVNGTTGHLAGSLGFGLEPDATLASGTYVANGQGDNVSRFTGWFQGPPTPRAMGSIPAGLDPVGLGFGGPAGDLYVANAFSNNVTVVSPLDGHRVASIPTPGPNSGIADALRWGAGQDVYVLGYDEGVTVIDPVNQTVVGVIPTGFDSFPTAGVFGNTSPGPLYILNELGGAGQTGNITIINTTDDRTDGSLATGADPDSAVTLSPPSANGAVDLYVSNLGSRNITVIDLRTGASIASFPLPGLPTGLGADGTSLGVTTVDPSRFLLLNATTGAIEENESIGSDPVAPTYAGFGYWTILLEGASAIALTGPFAGLPGAPDDLLVNETGLPSGAPWQLTLTGSGGPVSESLTGPSLAVRVDPGSYNWTVAADPDGGASYRAEVSQGSVDVLASGSSLNVTFVPHLIDVEFEFAGLPPSTDVQVYIGPPFGRLVSSGASAANELSVGLSNGTYDFTIAEVPGYFTLDPDGVLNVTGAPLMVNCSFSPIPGPPGTVQGIPATELDWVVALAIVAVLAVLVLAILLGRPRRSSPAGAPPGGEIAPPPTGPGAR